MIVSGYRCSAVFYILDIKFNRILFLSLVCMATEMYGFYY